MSSEREYDITHTRIGRALGRRVGQLLLRLTEVERSPAFGTIDAQDRAVLVMIRQMMLNATEEALAQDPDVLARLDKDPQMIPIFERMERKIVKIERRMRERES